jgi:AAA15 family ATPase/GTPase
MNPIFTIKNFRSFGNDNADFEIAPITILTGCNSAGKSSLVKAQLLLEQVLQRLPKEIETFHCMPINIPNDIKFHTSDKALGLGNFAKVLNRNAKDGVITLSYTIYSNYLAEKANVTFEFIEQPDNVVGDGLLHAVCIEKLDGTRIFQISDIQLASKELFPAKDTTIGDREAIINNFTRYMLFNLLVKWHEADNTAVVDEPKTKSNYEHIKDLCEKYGFINRNGDKITLLKDASRYVKIPPLKEKLPFVETFDHWLEDGTFYSYLPIFKEVDGKEIKAVREYLSRKLKDGRDNYTNPDKIQDWIQYFCDEIEESPFLTFKDYFCSKEQEFRRCNFDAPITSYSIDRLYGDGFRVDEDGNFIPAPQNDNRLSCEDYKKWWSFPSIVKALETICFDGEKLEYMNPERYNSAIPQDSDYLNNCLGEFFKLVIFECLAPSFLDNIKYVNSSSVAIKRMYSIEDNDKIGDCLRSFLNGNRQHFTSWVDKREVEIYNPGAFTNKWVDKFDIGKEIKIEGTDEGLGILVYLIKRDDNKCLLADEGYGITQLIALLLQIENNILTATRKKYGIPGFLTTPFKYEPSVIYVEEPEVHLHPKYQSLLADLFVEAFQKYNIRFIIETHSEYLIRKLQVMVADKDISLTSDKISLNYVEKDETTGISTNRQIKILEDGRLSEPFGSGFFDEAGNSARKLLLLKTQQ